MSMTTSALVSAVHSLLCVSVMLLVAADSPPSLAQTAKWPQKPVRMIVPLAPGGGTDIIARLFATKLSVELGQQFVADNRSGAGGTIGAEIAARANPDGYTLITVPASYAANAALYRIPYDPVKGIAPIGMITTGPLILTVHPAVPAKSLKELVGVAHAKPGTLNFGSSGTGSFSHLAAELFRQMSKTELVHVPYKSAGPALTDLLGGQIQIFFGSGPSTGAHIRAGRLRGLAVTTAQRSPALPELPAIGEMFPGYAADFWFGMWAPAGTPNEVVARVNRALAEVLKQPDVLERLRTDGYDPVGSTPEEFRSVIARDIATWRRVVKDGNIKVE
jgi:tripartite-type tricarboxylate transporter receptor subunit TctC